MGWLATVGVLCALHLASGENNYRLPGDITPHHYDVRLLYDIDPGTNYSFYGVVDILLSANIPTSKIVLHAEDFTIAEEKVTLVGDSAPAVTEVSLNTTFNLLTLELDEELQQHENYTLIIPFYGNLMLGLDGVYISSYVDKDTKVTEYLIASQFEAISARKGFPCFDEPIFKATFRMTIGHHKNFTAVSNMPLKLSSPDNALESHWSWNAVGATFKKDQASFVWDQFEVSVPMSTYLVAFVVSKFQFVESPRDLSNTRFRIWARSDAIDQVIAHELAHQWFGNLVTMKWWSDLWLNEGFATFAASVGVAAVEPTWQADRNYAVDNIMAVLSLDALESSHPVSAPIDDPKRISEIFDEISYRKGSTLIRMMTMFLGDKVFKEAIHNYLVKYSYQNAEQDDLWQQLTDASVKYGVLTRNVTVKRVMDTWTTQTGYPLLTVQRDYAANTLSVAQKRYLALGAKTTSNGSWWVPLNVLCETDNPQAPVPLQWLSDGEGIEDVRQFEHGAGKDEWVLFNHDMIAPYRVNYDTRNWQLLTETLKSSKYGSLPVLGRVQLLSDAFELAWTNRLDYTIALQLASYLQHEEEYLPLETGLRALYKVENVLKRSPEYGAFQKYVRRLVGDTYQRAGGLATKRILNGEDLNSVKMQLLTSSWACRMKVPGCEENAMELFQSWMDTSNPDENNPIPIDLRRTVYCVGISRGSVKHWRFILARKQNANVAAARDALLYALTCTREVWILHQYLEWAITDGSEVRRQDAATVIVGVLRSSVGYYVAKDFVYDRIADINVAFNNQGRRLGHIIKSLLDQFTKQRELDESYK